MQRISTLQKNKEKYLNNDNLYGWAGNLEIYIEENGRDVPFLTIYRKKDNSVIRIKMETNEYYRWNDSVRNTLSSDELKILNKCLQSYTAGSSLTDFQYYIYTWNNWNETILSSQTQQPDYNNIKEPNKNNQKDVIKVDKIKQNKKLFS